MVFEIWIRLMKMWKVVNSQYDFIMMYFLHDVRFLDINCPIDKLYLILVNILHLMLIMLM